MAVQAKVAELGKRPVRQGAVYMTLIRMEEKGYLTSWMTDPIPERGGRSRRCYKLLAPGKRALRNSAETARRVYETVDQLWLPKPKTGPDKSET